MIQLNPDCVVLELEGGNNLPCSVELMTVELLGETSSWMDPEILKNINHGVIVYLRDELGKQLVSFEEFAEVLKKIGFRLPRRQLSQLPTPPPRDGRL